MNEFKRGTTFDFVGVATDENDAAVDLTGYAVEAQLRRWSGSAVGDLIADLEGELLVDAGNFRVHFDDMGATESWALGCAAFDIVFVTPGGDRLPSPGFVVLDIIDPATQASP